MHQKIITHTTITTTAYTLAAPPLFRLCKGASAREHRRKEKRANANDRCPPSVYPLLPCVRLPLMLPFARFPHVASAAPFACFVLISLRCCFRPRSLLFPLRGSYYYNACHSFCCCCCHCRCRCFVRVTDTYRYSCEPPLESTVSTPSTKRRYPPSCPWFLLLFFCFFLGVGYGFRI